MQRQKRLKRLQVMLSAIELSVLDEWRFQNRMPSRAEAVRTLLRNGFPPSLRNQLSHEGTAASGRVKK